MRKPARSPENRHERKLVLTLDAERTRQLLQEAPAAYRTQVNDLLLTALARATCRWSGDASVLVQLEGHGREDLGEAIDLSRTVGWFTSLFPLRLTPAADLGESLKAIKEQLRCVPDKGVGYGLAALPGWRGGCGPPGRAAAAADHLQLPGPVRPSVRWGGAAGTGHGKRRCRPGSVRPAGQLVEHRRPGLRWRAEPPLELQPGNVRRGDCPAPGR